MFGSKDQKIAASEIGRAAYCPKALELKYAGAKVSKDALKRIARGDAMHDSLNHDIERSDKRCYVASYALGIDHPDTIFLRDVRDYYLAKYPRVAPIVVQCYYRLSPTLVDICCGSKWVDRFVRIMLSAVIRRLR